jgi:hypothetical protein
MSTMTRATATAATDPAGEERVPMIDAAGAVPDERRTSISTTSPRPAGTSATNRRLASGVRDHSGSRPEGPLAEGARDMEPRMKKDSKPVLNGDGADRKNRTATRTFNLPSLVLALLLAGSVSMGCSSSDSTETSNGADTSTTDASESADTDDTPSDPAETGETPPEMGEGGPPGDGGPADESDINKTGVHDQDGGTETEEGQSYAATETDESAIYVHGGGSYTSSGATLTKTGDTSSDSSSNFYGNNAIVLAEDESTIALTDCSLTADSEGSNGAFAYGEGSTITLDNCTISTTANSSRGVDATYGGSVTITNSEITTAGDHSAALATDRYDDNDPPSITADNVTGTTSGDGSPGIYSTGTFVVSNSDLVATGSEAAAIEGFNSITLTNSDIAGSAKWGAIIYQSTSGDSSVGTGTLDMSGGSLTNDSSGPVFMVVNTEAIIDLDDVDITTQGDVLIRATDASAGDANVNSDWGSSGGDVTFNATDQELDGSVSVNELSSVAITLSGTSTLTGAVEVEDGGSAAITLEDSATWTATGDSQVASLDGVTFSGSTPTNVDADSGVVIYYTTATDADGNALTGTYTLAGGGTLVEA